MSKFEKPIQLLEDTVKRYIDRKDVWETLTKKELADLLRKEYPGADSLFKKLDADGGNKVKFEEFVDIATDSKLMSSTTSDITAAMTIFKNIFNEYAKKDSSKNTLNKQELCALLQKEYKGTISVADVNRLLPQLDGNDDGVISFNEFVTVVVLNCDL